MEPEVPSTAPAQQHNSALQQRFRRLFALYQKQLEEHPILTKAITSAVLAGIGDITSQWIVQLGQPVKRPIAWRSVAAFSSFSLVVTAPATHYMYQVLEAIVPLKSQLSSVRKVLIDRLVFAPPYLLALLYTVALLEGKSSSEAWQRVKAVYWSVLVKNWIIWGITQYINMSYVPLKFRVLFANLVALVWNIYIAVLRR